MSQITVSIFMLTYNQEAYIKQAIEGVLMQNTNFKFQLVIGEDFSTDSTRKICESYQEKYPEKIKLLPESGKNIGLIKNYIRTIKACDGKYIAICDGDDFWIDEYKLQKQVDFLENNPEYKIVATNLNLLFSDGKMKESTKKRKKSYYDFDDLILQNNIASVTILFLNIQNSMQKVPQWLRYFPYGDWPTYLWTIKDGGGIYFLDDITAVYRIDVGISAKIRKQHSEIAKTNLKIVEFVNSDSNFSHKSKIISKSLIKHKKEIMVCLNREKQFLKGFIWFLKLFISSNNRLSIIKFYLYSLKMSL